MLRVVRFSTCVLLWPVLYAIAWAATISPLTYTDRIAAFGNNGLDRAEGFEQRFYVLGAAEAIAFLLVGFLCVGRAGYWDWRVEERAVRFNRFFAISLAAPFLAALTLPGVESSRPIHTMFFIASATVCVMSTVAFRWEAFRRAPATEASGWALLAPWDHAESPIARYSAACCRSSIAAQHLRRWRSPISAPCRYKR